MNPSRYADELLQNWKTILGCMIAASVGTIGLHAYTSGVFAAKLMTDTPLTRDQLSLATFLLSSSVAVLAPFVGALMDKYGPIRIIMLSLAGEALAFAVLGLIPADFTYYAVTIIGLAVLGVGTTPPGYSRIITERFDQSRGIALGMAICGLGIMAVASPIVINWVIENWGWRVGYFIVAAAVLCLGGGGLTLIASDSKTEAHRSTLKPRRRQSGDWSALRKPWFWILLVAFLAPGLFGGGYLLHLVSILRERGIGPAEAAQVQSLVGLAVFAGRLGSGAAMDRFFAPYVAAVTFLISGCGCLILLTDAPAMMYVAAFAIGLTIGSELDIMAYTFSRYFGVESFGRLYGLAYGGLITFSGFSPVLISYVEGWGSYSAALVVSALGTSSGAIILLFAPKFPFSPTLAPGGEREPSPSNAVSSSPA